MFESFTFIGDFKRLKNIIKTHSYSKSKALATVHLLLIKITSKFQKRTSVETGLSDFHCTIVTVVRDDCVKQDARIISYRHYCKIDIGTSRNHANERLFRKSQRFDELGQLCCLVISVLNKYENEIC